MAGREIQRGENFELTYTRKVGSRTYQVSAYRESVSNAALSMVAPAGMYAGGDILPDLFTGTSTFNAGDYHSSGYTAAVTQNLGEHVSATVMYGSMGALTADNREIVSDSPDELRIHDSRRTPHGRHGARHGDRAVDRHALDRQLPGDRRSSLGIARAQLTAPASVRQMPGLNLYVRQPIPGLGMLPWRMEATADLRNMLAQGYLPLGIAGGQQLMLVETPRSVPRRTELHFLSERPGRLSAHRFPPALHSRIPSVPRCFPILKRNRLRWLGGGREPPQRRRDPLAARAGRAA